MLQQQLMDFKNHLDRIDTSQLKKEMDVSRSKARRAEEEVRTLKKELAIAKSNTKDPESGAHTDDGLIRKLEEENLNLHRMVKELSSSKSHLETVSPIRKVESETKRVTTSVETTEFGQGQVITTAKKTTAFTGDIDELLLREGGLMGEVSYEEMIKLEERIKEFGDCNLELEDIIYKLKAKLLGTEYKPPHHHNCSNYSSNSTERKFRSKDAERFQSMLSELRIEVDRLSGVKSRQAGAGGSFGGMSDVVYQLEDLMMRNRRLQESDHHYHQLLKNFATVSDELADLKDRYRQLEIKYNTVITVNVQNEGHMEKLLSQIHDNKDYFRKLISDVETLKIKERDLSAELTDCLKRNSNLQDINDELTRRSSTL